MAKLSSLPPRIGSAPAKIGRPPHQATSPKLIRQEALLLMVGTRKDARWRRCRTRPGPEQGLGAPIDEGDLRDSIKATDVSTEAWIRARLARVLKKAAEAKG